MIGDWNVPGGNFTIIIELWWERILIDFEFEELATVAIVNVFEIMI